MPKVISVICESLSFFRPDTNCLTALCMALSLVVPSDIVDFMELVTSMTRTISACPFVVVVLELLDTLSFPVTFSVRV